MSARSDRLAAYIGFYETLVPESLERLERHFTGAARFRDPFNDVRGRAAIRGVFRHMFATTAAPRFAVTEAVESGEVAYLRWVFTCRVRGRSLEIGGLSRVRFAADGRVAEHLDYWDPAAGLYERLPLVGALLRWLRRRMAP